MKRLNELEVIFEDNNIIVVNKINGLLSVPGKKEYDSVQTRIKKEFVGAVAVHRLDMETSGIMLIAKHKEAERFYKTCFEKRLVKKYYIAKVYGIPREKKGEINLALCTNWGYRPLQSVCFEHGKPSRTIWRKLSSIGEETYMFLLPITGRTHQLRVHLSEIGFPIIGDKLYGNKHCLENSKRLCLHAAKLKIPSMDGKLFSFKSLPDF